MDGCPRVGILRERHQEWATATTVGPYLLLERVEEREDARACGATVGARRIFEPRLVRDSRALEVRFDDLVLRFEEPVERGGSDPGFVRDAIDADAMNTAPIEEIVRDVEHVLARDGGGCALPRASHPRRVTMLGIVHK